MPKVSRGELITVAGSGSGWGYGYGGSHGRGGGYGRDTIGVPIFKVLDA